MNVNLTSPIAITIDSAKLVVEDSGSGTIEFMLFNQPVRLCIDSTNYVYDINFAIGDRIRLLQNFSFLSQNSEGIVVEIIADYTNDLVKVLFDHIIPDQTVNPAEVHIASSLISLMVEVPLSIVEKI